MKPPLEPRYSHGVNIPGELHGKSIKVVYTTTDGHIYLTSFIYESVYIPWWPAGDQMMDAAARDANRRGVEIRHVRLFDDVSTELHSFHERLANE